MMDAQWPEHFELTYYGSVVTEYSGTGVLQLQDGNELACSFVAGQISDGSVLAICKFTSPPSAVLFGNLQATCLSGVTENGYKVTSIGDVCEFEGIRRLSLSTNSAEGIGAYKLDSLLVQIMDPNTSIESVSYGLTNFIMMGYQWSAEYMQRVLPISIYHHDESVAFTVMRVDEYDLIARRMQRLHLPQVTCTAKCSISESVTEENADRAVSDLCLFLSVAMGSLVQWLYRENITNGNQVVSRIHHSHYTSYYSSYRLIDPIETMSFVDCASRKFNSERNWFDPNRWSLYSYICAKEGKGFLETQGVAMAIALEALKDISLDR